MSTLITIAAILSVICLIKTIHEYRKKQAWRRKVIKLQRMHKKYKLQDKVIDHIPFDMKG